jgi:hypothetical protein
VHLSATRRLENLIVVGEKSISLKMAGVLRQTAGFVGYDQARQSRQMAAMRGMLLLVIVTTISAQLTSAQQSKKVTITEPGIYELSALFK